MTDVVGFGTITAAVSDGITELWDNAAELPRNIKQEGAILPVISDIEGVLHPMKAIYTHLARIIGKTDKFLAPFMG